MNADNANRWLTLLANVGVVIGLALLIFEIRQNSELVRMQIHQARTDTYIESNMALADSDHLIAAWEKVSPLGATINTAALDDLDPLEYARVYRFMQLRAVDYSNLYYQRRHGYLDDEYYESRVERSVRSLAPVWYAMGILQRFSPSFRAEVERIMEEE